MAGAMSESTNVDTIARTSGKHVCGPKIHLCWNDRPESSLGETCQLTHAQNPRRYPKTASIRAWIEDLLFKTACDNR